MARKREEAKTSEILDLCMASGFAALLIGLLYVYAPPRWETNDDVAMSMITHGYGIAAPGAAPQLLFSNIFWGYLARSIPKFGAVLGYSTATMAATFLACTGIFYGLRRLGAGIPCCLLAAALIFSRPVLFPQFTLNAGMLTIASFALWLTFALDRRVWVLAASGAAAILACLIRSQEFLLVLAMALPFVSPQSVRSKAALTAIVAVSGVIGAAVAYDYVSYRTEAWQAFNALNPARARLTDFRAGESLREHPEVASRHGYSLNDVALVEQWFFVDPKIADPGRLDALLSDSADRPARGDSNVGASLKAFGHPSLQMLVAIALLGTALWPSRRLFLAWGIFLAAIMAIGFFGRPGVVRVYLPAVGFLALVPLLQRRLRWNPARAKVYVLALALAAAANAWVVMREARLWKAEDLASRSQMVGFPQSDPVVIWGVGFPFEAVYPPFGASDEAMNFKLYGLGVSTLAPFSVAHAEQQSGRGMIERLLSNEGVSLLATENSRRLLSVYCREHHGGALHAIGSPREGGVIAPQRYRCF